MSALSSEPAPVATEAAIGFARYPASGGFDGAGSNRIGAARVTLKRNAMRGDWPA